MILWIQWFAGRDIFPHFYEVMVLSRNDETVYLIEGKRGHYEEVPF